MRLLNFLKYLGITILVIIGIFALWFRFYLSEFEEFKNATPFEHRTYISTDGPYCIFEKDSVRLIQVVENSGEFEVQDNKLANNEFTDSLQVASFSYDLPSQVQFEVKLMDTIEIPQSKYELEGDVFSVSDIEGNFYAFYKLLRAAKVIDQNCNWTFGHNNLVLIGDFVDRGLNVTQCLWLIYKLEQQAQEFGGSVHFIMGNHETMNLKGSIANVRSKYTRLAKSLDLDYSNDLIGENSELGRWLRSKNVMEIINDNLFVHGGVSPKLISTNLTLDRINQIARKYYAQPDTIIQTDSLAKIIYSTYEGPLWYRENTRKVSDNILNEMTELVNHYQVKSLIIGHSTKRDIKAQHNRMLYNIDVHFPHADTDSIRGKGLLISKEGIFKLNDLGDRYKLE
ncbi:metallophosphoesterase [Ancylomarina sp. YFZ004]